MCFDKIFLSILIHLQDNKKYIINNQNKMLRRFLLRLHYRIIKEGTMMNAFQVC